MQRTKAKKPYRMAEPSDNAIEMRETFLVPDAFQMHNTALIENEAVIKIWERYLRKEVFPGQQYTLITRALYTYQNMKKTSVILHRAFPILENATICTINPDFVPKRSDIDALGNVHMHFVSSFDTLNHGRVHLIGITAMGNPDKRCTLKMGMVTASNPDGTPKPPSKERGDLTLSMTNLGDLNDICLFFITMIVPFTGCRGCGFMGTSKTTRAKMSKCSRCWDNLLFPVCYCSKSCQVVDFQRHSKMDGCGCISKN